MCDACTISVIDKNNQQKCIYSATDNFPFKMNHRLVSSSHAKCENALIWQIQSLRWQAQGFARTLASCQTEQTYYTYKTGKKSHFGCDFRTNDNYDDFPIGLARSVCSFWFTFINCLEFGSSMFSLFTHSSVAILFDSVSLFFVVIWIFFLSCSALFLFNFLSSTHKVFDRINFPFSAPRLRWQTV